MVYLVIWFFLKLSRLILQWKTKVTLGVLCSKPYFKPFLEMKPLKSTLGVYLNVMGSNAVGLDRTGHMSFLTGQDRTPKFAGQVLPDRTKSGLMSKSILQYRFSKNKVCGHKFGVKSLQLGCTGKFKNWRKKFEIFFFEKFEKIWKNYFLGFLFCF